MNKLELKSLIIEVINEMSDPENDQLAFAYLKEALPPLKRAAEKSNSNTIDGKDMKKLWADAKKIYKRSGK